MRTADGTLIVLDCGTGAHDLGRALVESRSGDRGHLLISHTHWDHIQGFPFFAPLRGPSCEWDVYGPRGLGPSLCETLAGQMNYTYFPVDLTGLDAHVKYRELIEGTFELGDVRVEARYLNHPAVTLGYRLEADGVVVVYATDHEPHSHRLAIGEPTSGPSLDDDAHAEFLEGADLVIHDTQYTAEEYPEHVGWGHSTVEYAVDRTLGKGIGRLALFHHDPLRADEGVDRLARVARERYAAASERVDALAAAEGLTLEVEPRASRSRAHGNSRPAREPPSISASAQTVILCARGRENVEVFRGAAEDDGLTLVEVVALDDVVGGSGELAPAVIVFERMALGPDCDAGIRAVLRAVSTDEKPPPSLVGLVSRNDTEWMHSCTVPGVEWVETPITEQYARTRLRASLLRRACRWSRAPSPDGEHERLQALRELNVLDTPAEERFDRYTRLAAALFRVPTALVSLVDADRQWFKSRHGLDVHETPRDRAFCAHVILEPDVLQITDARIHPDFADNPLVRGFPFVRFYAGVPLTTSEGHRIGTLCLIDYLPRELDEKEKELLRDLGQLVERELERAAPE